LQSVKIFRGLKNEATSSVFVFAYTDGIFLAIIDDWGKRGQLKVLVVDTESVAL
jgi:hypothetical protein